jgi:ribose/xylose/arabinose/galactoside ABC-type transport system permease subunit
MNLLRDTIAGWPMSARWPAWRRRRFRLGLLLYLVGARRLAVRVAGVPTGGVDWP